MFDLLIMRACLWRRIFRFILLFCWLLDMHGHLILRLVIFVVGSRCSSLAFLVSTPVHHTYPFGCSWFDDKSHPHFLHQPGEPQENSRLVSGTYHTTASAQTNLIELMHIIDHVHIHLAHIFPVVVREPIVPIRLDLIIPLVGFQMAPTAGRET
ncbi:uncharacterized protein BDW43DRAFT_7365 [Aspergillus alliaceus]|uniref:uncharacterized protein n=1 Tax=Petromyces alliaceus TaxID=209559 RepID=UPI0012A6DD56|nr:uncharacterized protein BDW43DRAFT_7365 [Aspergillus alliaceus]KAB8239554.1 hypothetical protein BDW43DRAFT_7365 [Aspergillus alliaceus]